MAKYNAQPAVAERHAEIPTYPSLYASIANKVIGDVYGVIADSAAPHIRVGCEIKNVRFDASGTPFVLISKVVLMLQRGYGRRTPTPKQIWNAVSERGSKSGVECMVTSNAGAIDWDVEYELNFIIYAVMLMFGRITNTDVTELIPKQKSEALADKIAAHVCRSLIDVAIMFWDNADDASQQQEPAPFDTANVAVFTDMINREHIMSATWGVWMSYDYFITPDRFVVTDDTTPWSYKTWSEFVRPLPRAGVVAQYPYGNRRSTYINFYEYAMRLTCTRASISDHEELLRRILKPTIVACRPCGGFTTYMKAFCHAIETAFTPMVVIEPQCCATTPTMQAPTVRNDYNLSANFDDASAATALFNEIGCMDDEELPTQGATSDSFFDYGYCPTPTTQVPWN